MKKLLTTFSLLIFILAGNYIINTDHISTIHVYKDTYKVCFDYGSYNPDCINISKKAIPDLLDQLQILKSPNS